MKKEPENQHCCTGFWPYAYHPTVSIWHSTQKARRRSMRKENTCSERSSWRTVFQNNKMIERVCVRAMLKRKREKAINKTMPS